MAGVCFALTPVAFLWWLLLVLGAQHMDSACGAAYCPPLSDAAAWMHLCLVLGCCQHQSAMCELNHFVWEKQTFEPSPDAVQQGCIGRQRTSEAAPEAVR